MAIEDKLDQILDPDFGDKLVRLANELNDPDVELQREMAVMGRAFIDAINELIPLNDLDLDEQAVIRDAIRAHLQKLRINGKRIPRRKGILLLLTEARFMAAQQEAIREIAADLQIPLFVELLKTKLQVYRVTHELEKATVKAERRAIDKVTQLPTREYGAEKIARRVKEQPFKPAGILILDIDHFKLVNDELGHAKADGVLGKVADIIRKQVHSGDIVLRYGGEEIMILLEVDTREQAVKVAQRLRVAIQKQTSVTVSIGVEFAPRHQVLATRVDAGTVHPPELVEFDLPVLIETPDESGYIPDINGPAMKRADDALYRAKDKYTISGRNQVVAAWSDEAEPRDFIDEDEDTNP